MCRAPRRPYHHMFFKRISGHVLPHRVEGQRSRLTWQQQKTVIVEMSLEDASIEEHGGRGGNAGYCNAQARAKLKCDPRIGQCCSSREKEREGYNTLLILLE